MTTSRAPLAGRAGAVASPHSAATEAGAEVLAAGGNALDAAIATNAILAVLYPHMCGIGGDLFLLYHEAATGTVHCLNGTGAAPALATPQAFAERGLQAVPARGPLPVTVPGAVGAWEAAVARFGSRPLADLLAPAIATADAGVAVTERLASWVAEARADIAQDPAMRRLFLDDGGAPVAPGTTLRQTALAETLRRLAHAGAADLYHGELADAIDAAVRAADGLLRASDLAAYRPDWVVPIRTRHQGLDVVTTPPNSQAITALLMLDHMGAENGQEPGTARYVEDFVAAKRHAFALRDAYVTDPAHMTVGAEDLLAGAVPAATGVAPPPRGDTVYLCTVDGEGNACSLIQSIYYAFGSCFVAGDTGILLHNRGHYFSLDPAAANVVAPGKRTLHTLMASMALDEGRLRFVFGTMGADGQPQTTVQVLHQLLRGRSAQDAVGAPRFLHGRFALEDDPELLHVEADYGSGALETLGRTAPLDVVPAHSEIMGHSHAIAIDADGGLTAGADPRSDGSAAVVG